MTLMGTNKREWSLIDYDISNFPGLRFNVTFYVKPMCSMSYVVQLSPCVSPRTGIINKKLRN
jgi:hypothetical protein